MAKKPTENRIIAYGVLTELRKSEQMGAPLKAGEYIRDTLEKYDYLPAAEKAFVKRLIEGCLERRITLDYVIEQYANTKNGKIKPAVKDLLRMSIYQILYMDSVPDAAAVNEAVLIAEKKGLASLKNFVNGVLRAVVREKDVLPWPGYDKEPVRFLSVCYSFPEWIAGLFRKRLGMETTETIFRRMNMPAQLIIRISEAVSKEDTETLMRSWDEVGINYRKHPYSEKAFIFEKVPGVDKVPGFKEGKFTVQDISSQLSVRCLSLQKGQRVLDLCASPGGKTCLAAELVGEEGSVTARDISEGKLIRIQENLERLHISNVQLEESDASIYREDDKEKYDAVIADLPCSGLGVMGRKNDIRYRVCREDLRTLSLLQKDILENAVSYLKKGGRLLFSTCTISKEENEDNRKYLIEELGMLPISIEETLPSEICAETAREGYLQMLPGIHDSDGFFISLYEKR